MAKKIGFDVGSSAAKIVRIEDGEISYRISGSRNWHDLLDGEEPDNIISTGYFRNTVPHRYAVTEITAAIFGARHYFREAEVVVDIGGQDTKVIDIRNNSFRINDKCSAGTGAFLEFVAGYFGLAVDDLGRLHFKASKVPAINNTCSVFALSEMISLLVEGFSTEDVVAGMHHAFARRISRMIPDAENIVLIGGTVKNKGMVAALEGILGRKVLIPPEPQIVNAVGAIGYFESEFFTER